MPEDHPFSTGTIFNCPPGSGIWEPETTPDFTPVDAGLFAVFAVVLLGPFLWKRVEQNLELFLFICGVAAATIASVWEWVLVRDAVVEPVIKGIVPAVLVAGLVFHYGKDRIRGGITSILRRIPLRGFVFLMVVGLGLVSSVITAIIAALLLVEITYVLPLDRRRRVEVVIISCFSIGLGAVLTPLGEPLSTIAIAALDGAPYHAGFFFLLVQLGVYVLPGLVVFGALAAILVGRQRPRLLERLLFIKPFTEQPPGMARPAAGAPPASAENSEIEQEKSSDVLVRAGKVYLFVVALILLGGGMKVVIDKYFVLVPSEGLFWANIVSAVLDNATLTAAEIGPSLNLMQIRSALMALLIAGGMLIPGNIPNIIAAHKLKIGSREWASLGLPLGLAAMLLYFIWLYVIPFP